LATYLQQLLDFATAHPSIFGLIVFLFSASEAIVIVGAFIPGTSIVLALAGVAGAAQANIWLLTLWAFGGAIAGDGVSFWIGRRYGDRLRRVWPFRRRPALLDRGAAFFQRQGAKSVFFARFLPGVRAVVPVSAGMLGMSSARFYTANVASAVVWAVSHVVLAASVGVAFATLGNMSGRLALLAGVVLIAAVMVFWLVLLTVRWLAPMAAFAYGGAVAHLGARDDALSRRLARMLDPAKPRLAVLALWSGVLVAATIGFLGVLEDLLTGDPLVRADIAINELAQSLRTPFGDAVMVIITSLGDIVVIGGLTAIVVAWLLLRRAFATAGAVALAMGVSTAFVFVMKAVLHKPRPTDIFVGADAFSFPSGHATLATVLYGVIAVLVSKSLPRTAQIAVFSAAAIGAGAIGLSRIYLAAHWPSDVFGGVFFGLAMTAIFALIFEHLPAEKIGRAGLAAVAVAAFAVLGAWHASNSLQENLTLYARQTTQASFGLDAWLTKDWQNLPRDRTDLVGETEEPIAVQWAGDADQLAVVLSNADWLGARPWSAKDALQFLNPAATLAGLPPLPLLNDGLFPVLTMIQPLASDNNRRLVFRAWPSQTDVVTGDVRVPILVGSITLEEMTHPFGLITTLRDQSLFGYGSAVLSDALRADATIEATVPSAGQNQAGPTLALPIGLLSRNGDKAGSKNRGSPVPPTLQKETP